MKVSFFCIFNVYPVPVPCVENTFFALISIGTLSKINSVYVHLFMDCLFSSLSICIYFLFTSIFLCQLYSVLVTFIVSVLVAFIVSLEIR